MKRFHVHVAVTNLDEGIRFYSTLFGARPVRVESDYARWMIEDPRINFAISRRQAKVGVDHLGFQVDAAGELPGLRARLYAADAGLVAQTAAACCYATSDKYWVKDPAGVAWETFHTLGSIPVFGNDTGITAATGGCEPGTRCTDLAPCQQSSATRAPETCCA